MLLHGACGAQLVAQAGRAACSGAARSLCAFAVRWCAQALGLKPKSAPSTHNQPALEKHEVERLLKGGADDQDPSAAGAEADRMKGLGFKAGCAPYITQLVSCGSLSALPLSAACAHWALLLPHAVVRRPTHQHVRVAVRGVLLLLVLQGCCGSS